MRQHRKWNLKKRISNDKSGRGKLSTRPFYKTLVITMNSAEQIPITQLKSAYEDICQEYVRRLCEAWEIPLEEAWWHGDEIGGGLFLADWWYPLGMQELRYVVENNVTHDVWMEYCAYVEAEINNGNERPLINFHSWFALNARPEILNNG